MNFRTDFLFAMPSFLGGMASVLDIGSTLTGYNDSRSTQEADARAMYCDWGVVGQDLRAAIDQLKKDFHGSQPQTK